MDCTKVHRGAIDSEKEEIRYPAMGIGDFFKSFGYLGL